MSFSTDLSRLLDTAKDLGWCTRFNCTTCGTHEFRSALKKFDRDSLIKQLSQLDGSYFWDRDPILLIIYQTAILPMARDLLEPLSNTPAGLFLQKAIEIQTRRNENRRKQEEESTPDAKAARVKARQERKLQKTKSYRIRKALNLSLRQSLPPFVNVVCVGEAGKEAALLMQKEGLIGADFVYYNQASITEDAVSKDLENAHLVIILGVLNSHNVDIFNCIWRVSKRINLLTLGIIIKETDVDFFTVDQQSMNTAIFVSTETVLSTNQSAADFLNLAGAGLAEVLSEKQRLHIDFYDIEDLFKQKGSAVIGCWVASGPERTIVSINAALTQLYRMGVDFKGAKAALVILKANSQISNRDASAACELVFNRSDKNISAPDISDEASCMVALVEGGNFADEIRVTIILTGLI